MDISIIIVNYNVKDLLIACIDSISKYSKSGFKYEIIIVNNSIHDALEEEINNKFGSINVINNPKNVGFSKAVNQAFEKALGEHILILNPDTVFIENSLKKLLHKSNKSKNPCIIGPKILTSKMQLEKSHWRKPRLITTILSLFYLNTYNFWKNYNNSENKRGIFVDTISGCAMFMKSDIFNKLDGFNADLFWMEDIDLCVRAKKEGFDVIFFPNAQIIHYGGQSSKSNPKIRIFNQLLSKIKYYNIHHTKIEVLILYFTVFINLIFKILLFLPTSFFAKSNNSKFYAYLYTFKVFIRGKF